MKIINKEANTYKLNRYMKNTYYFNSEETFDMRWEMKSYLNRAITNEDDWRDQLSQSRLIMEWLKHVGSRYNKLNKSK